VEMGRELFLGETEGFAHDLTWGIRFSFFWRSGVRGLLSGSHSAAAAMAASLRWGRGPG